MDYLMEHCVLHYDIPHSDSVRGFEPSVVLRPDPSTVDVWRLDMDSEISRYIKGSMDFAPARKQLLATLIMSTMESSQSEVFPCPSGKYTTLEVACPLAGACGVDFWQNQRANPRGGELSTTCYPLITHNMARTLYQTASISSTRRIGVGLVSVRVPLRKAFLICL